MPLDAQTTAFVTGAAGFVGLELVQVLAAHGLQVCGLVESADAAERVRRAGAMPVMGSLLKPGGWQDEAAADWVFHVPPSPTETARLTSRRADEIARERVQMDAHLLDAIEQGTTRRVVYVADASCYGAVGPRPVTEDEPPQPSRIGACLSPALERLEGYVIAGLPIVTALPGRVFGNGSWFRDQVIDPVLANRPVLRVGSASPWISPIHVHDCARALVHVARRGEPGGRYFLVNSEPIRMPDLTAAFARLARRRLRVWRMPIRVARLVMGRVLTDYQQADAVFSNIRLRGIGFRFEYPTLERGLQQVVEALDA